MHTIDAPERSADKGHPHGEFAAQISDESFNFREVRFPDRKVTGAQIAEAAGAHPIENFIILQQLESLELESMRPTELVDLTKPVRFFVIEGSGTDRFTADGLILEWPRKVVTGRTIKKLVGKDDDDIELVLELENVLDKIIDDDDEVEIGAPGVERFKTRKAKGPITILVDGEPYDAPRRVMTPNEIITDAAHKDPNTHHLVQITKHGKISYEGKGNEPIRLRKGMKFQVISTGPTPVSDDRAKTGAQAFLEALKALGYEVQILPNLPDHVVFNYVVETGIFQGKQVRHGLVVPADFPMTPPSGPYMSPEIHPVKTDGQHPLGGVHKDQARPFDREAGGSWQYWSRPFPEWGSSKRTVATYLSHIWKLWDSQ